MAETAHALDPRRLIPRQGHGWTPGAEVGWWPMREVLSGAEVMVPALGVFCPYEPEWGLWHSNTIGLASGNCPAEALLHGLYELIEHDATAFGEAFRLGYRVIPETMPEQAQALLERFSRAGIAVDVYTFTGDTGVPVFYVTSLDEHARDRMLINGGVGCSLDTTTALMRAINETAQSRLSVIAGAREDLDRQAYRRHASYEAMKEMLEQWGRTHTRVGFGEIPTHRTCCVRHTLDKVLAQIQGAGLDLVFASELAPADLPFSVVKAVVPGMEIHHEDRLRIGARLVRKAKELGPSPLFPESLRSLAGVV
jgi:ribosomal protein S12 methylthiotransferase accessory factor